MRIINYFTILILLFTTYSCNTLKSVDSYGGYNGKPKRVESTYHKVSYEGNKKRIDTLYTFISIYDNKGRRTVLRSLKKGEKPTKKGMFFTYDKFDNEIRVETKNNKGESYIINNYQFNKLGQQTFREYLLYSGDTLNRRVTTKTQYFRHKRRDSIISKKSDEKIANYIIQKYDSKWRKIEYSLLKPSGEVNKKYIYEYDEQGNIGLIKEYGASNVLSKFSIREYNEFNDLIYQSSLKIISSDTTKINDHRYLYKYDSKGNIIESKFFVNGQLKSIDKVKYVY